MIRRDDMIKPSVRVKAKKADAAFRVSMEAAGYQMIDPNKLALAISDPDNPPTPIPAEQIEAATLREDTKEYRAGPIMGLCMICGASMEAELEKRQATTLKMIAQQVCKKYDLTLTELRGKRRDARTVKARHEAFWRAHDELSHLSYPRVGRFFGERNHSTVIHGVKRHQERLDILNAVTQVLQTK